MRYDTRIGVYRLLIISSEGPWAPGPGPVGPWDRGTGPMGPWDRAHGTRTLGPWERDLGTMGPGPITYSGKYKEYIGNF